MAESETLTITNLGGPLTRRNNGDINSGLARYSTSWGYDPYSKPGNLTWMEQPTSILANDILVADMKQRTEGLRQFNYIYHLSNGGILRRIAVNSATNPNLDSPSIIGAFASDTYNSGGGMVFYGSERLFIGGDALIQTTTFTNSVMGASSTIGTLAAASNPRPFSKFLGKVYFGNGNNIGEIDSTNAIVSVARLSPALPAGLYVRDIDVSPDGNYLQITASGTNQTGIYGSDVGDTGTPIATDSFKFYWNGIDSGISAIQNYSGLVLSANAAFGEKNYSFGYNHNGTAIFSGAEKVVSLPNTINPNSSAVFPIGNMLGFVVPEYDTTSTRLQTSFFEYGKFDEEVPSGLFRLLRQRAVSRDDIAAVPAAISVSNTIRTPEQYGFTGNFSGVGKIYYSSVEIPSVAGAAFVSNLWKFHTAPTGTGSILAGVYETQTQLFSKKVRIPEVRLYTEPLIGGNDFVIDLIGSGGSVLSGGSQRFIVGTSSIATGTDMIHFNPATAPTYAVGVRITNSSVTGVANWTARKLEVDFDPAGK